MAKKTLKKLPVAANAEIEIEKPAKKAPARKRVAKAPAAAAQPPLDQDVQPAAQAPISLDYPQAGETITASHYTLRLTVPEGAAYVEVSIDDSAWQPCRFSVGHWWYDWADYASGRHTLRARAMGQDGVEASVKRVSKAALAATTRVG